jgi:hypothetical protein
MQATDRSEEMERKMIQWRILAQEMTPGGSEFMSPEAVRAYYREFKDSAHRAKITVVKLKRENERLHQTVRLWMKNCDNHMARGELCQFSNEVLDGKIPARFDELTRAPDPVSQTTEH